MRVIWTKKSVSMRRRTLATQMLFLSLANNGSSIAQSLAPETVRMAALAGAADMSELLVGVEVNGQPFAEPALLLQDAQGNLWAGADEFRRWRLRPPSIAPFRHEGADYYPLSGSSAWRYTFNPLKQELAISADAQAFLPSTQALSDQRAASPEALQLGGFFNYDLLGTRSEGDTQGAGQFEVGVFGSAGVGTIGLVAPALVSSSQLVRLDTTWTMDDPGKRQSLRLGDVVSRVGAWGYAARIGGVQWASNFSTQPGFISYPVQQAIGQATLPSTVDVYVNNALAASKDVPPGPFSITNLPVVSGSGDVRLVVRDMLGREQVISQPFYASSNLLARGISEFSYEAGLVRQNYGIASSDYGDWAASAIHRLGLSDSLTGEARLELQARQRAVGVGGMYLIPRTGVVNATLAASQGSYGLAGDQGGSLFALGFERQTQTLSFAVHSQWTSRGFREIGSDLAALPMAQQLTANAGYVTQDMGSFGMSYTKLLAYAGERAGLDVSTISYSRSLRNYGTLSLSAIRSRTTDNNTQLALLWTLPLSADHSVTLSRTNWRSDSQGNSHDTQAVLQKNYTPEDQYGYQILAHESGDAQASFQYENNRGAYYAEAARFGGTGSVRAGVMGGVVFLDGHAYTSRWLNDSFGVANVANFAGVRVYADNQLVGLTDESGNIVLPRLRPYENNKISIEARDLPLNAQIDSVNIAATPYFRAGVLAEFPVRTAHGALFRIVLDSGQVMPAGSTVELNEGKTLFPVANDGAVYVTGLVKQNRLVGRWKGQSCKFDLGFEPSNDPLPDLGQVTCHGVAP